MSTTLEMMYIEAVEKFGREAADTAADASIEAYNTTALAGMSQDECEAEQASAFRAALEQAGSR